MNLKPIIVITLIISAVLLAARISPAMNSEQYREGKYIHIDNIVMEFSGTNATIDVEYHLSPFAKHIYSFLAVKISSQK
ncbi:hypothetical protein [Methanosarcina barkeri]|uniref:hypothetical protein n=1 Tax=Methanosarcina barkeri TaxID=2208 RepID=UPI000AFA9AD2|nr:hypothetical protein [Methanosarcina barkeri]